MKSKLHIPANSGDRRHADGVFLFCVLNIVGLKSIFNVQKQHRSHLPYAYVIMRDTRSPRVSPLLLTFSQATGKESGEVAPITFSPSSWGSLFRHCLHRYVKTAVTLGFMILLKMDVHIASFIINQFSG